MMYKAGCHGSYENASDMIYTWCPTIFAKYHIVENLSWVRFMVTVIAVRALGLGLEFGQLGLGFRL